MTSAMDRFAIQCNKRHLTFPEPAGFKYLISGLVVCKELFLLKANFNISFNNEEYFPKS